MKKQTFFGGVAILIVASIVAKLLGAIYRIPLTWILGSEGLGMYQLVFPLFSLLLVISSTGMPSAISKMIAKRESNLFEINKIFKVSLISLFIFGLAAGILLFSCSTLIANMQGNSQIYLPYMVISFAVVLVSVLSAFRGYFQGRMNMLPTAMSNIVEQSGKLVFGLLFSYLFLGYGLIYGVAGAVLGVVLSELVAVLYMFIYYLKVKKEKYEIKSSNLTNKAIFKELIYTSFPIVLASFIIPFTLVIDSFLVINLLNSGGFNVSDSTVMWGINNGVVNSIINVPVVLTLGVATAVVPFLSAKSSDKSELSKGLWLAMNIAIPSAIGVAILSVPIIEFLYSNSLVSSNINGTALASNILLLSSGLIVFMALLQTQNAGMQGLNHSKIPVFNLLIAAIIKIVVLVMFVPINSINIYGVIISNYTFYGVAMILNAFYIKYKEKINLHFFKNLSTILGACLIMALGVLVLKNLLVNVNVYISLPICIIGGILLYLIGIISLKIELLEKVLFQFKKLKTKFKN